jgi:Uma2 family endonuclease
VAISLRLLAPPSDGDILDLSQRNPGLQIERGADGALIVTPASGKGGRRELLLGRQLDEWAEADGRGLVFGPSTGFRLPDGSLLSPDAAWIRRERWASLTDEQQESYVPLCPDATFEVLSRNDSLPRLRAKMRAYLANGAMLAVLVDPQRRAVEIYEPDREPRTLERGYRSRWTPCYRASSSTLCLSLRS